MEYITVSAKNLDDAITEALVQLGVTSDRLDYEVIEKGSTGFLGIGMKQAVIKARRKEEEKPVEEKVQKYEKPEKKEFKKKETKKEFKKEPVKPAKPVLKTETKLGKVEDNTIKVCEEFVKNVLGAMSMDNIKVASEIDDEGALSINVEGDNMGILIGKRGQTLDSLQYLVNRVANKQQDGYVRVKLDTENYRKRRKDTLENLAKNIAYKVKRTKKSISLEPMNPYERRIIHTAVQEIEGVTSRSVGSGVDRRVLIEPVGGVKDNGGHRRSRAPKAPVAADPNREKRVDRADIPKFGKIEVNKD